MRPPRLHLLRWLWAAYLLHLGELSERLPPRVLHFLFPPRQLQGQESERHCLVAATKAVTSAQFDGFRTRRPESATRG